MESQDLVDVERLSAMMEEMANLPESGPPERLSGEKCAYEGRDRSQNALQSH